MTPPMTSDNPVSSLATYLEAWLGTDALLRLRQTANLPYTDDLPTPADWLARALSTLFSLDDLQHLAQKLADQQLEARKPLLLELDACHAELDGLEKTQAATQQLLEQAQAGRERAEVDLHRLRRETAPLLPARPLLELLFLRDDERAIRQLLLEAADAAAPDLGTFVAAFGPAWQRLRDVPSQFGTDPTDNLRRLHAALTQLLTDLAGHTLPQRRPLLDAVAQWASAHLPDYLVVSPEESLQVDPAIHNAQGIGGSTVAEGRSFAVLRRHSRTVVLYADILAR
jgi:hypothetical protein